MGSRMDWSLQGPLPHPQRWWLFRAVAPSLDRGPEFYLDLPSLEDLL